MKVSGIIVFTALAVTLASVGFSSAFPQPQDGTTEKSGGFRKYIGGKIVELVMGTTTTTTTTPEPEPSSTQKHGTFGFRKAIAGLVNPSSTPSTTTTTEKSGHFGIRKYIAGAVLGTTTTTPKPNNVIERAQNAYRDAKEQVKILTDPKKLIMKQISEAINAGIGG